MKKYNMKINGEIYDAQILEYNPSMAKLLVNGVEYIVEFETEEHLINTQLMQMEKTIPAVPAIKPDSETVVITKSIDIKAPMPSVVVKILKNVGDKVNTGDVLITLEAMKMESEIVAPQDGIVEKILVKEKSPVQEGDLLIKISLSSISQPEPQKVKQPTPPPPQKPEKQPETQSISVKEIKAPLPGTILDIRVKVGDRVNTNRAVVVLEAMKMESEIFSDCDGIVKEILINKGQNVSDGQALIVIESSS
jgi:biotin carboxyl carrier protein